MKTIKNLIEGAPEVSIQDLKVFAIKNDIYNFTAISIAKNQLKKGNLEGNVKERMRSIIASFYTDMQMLFNLDQKVKHLEAAAKRRNLVNEYQEYIKLKKWRSEKNNKIEFKEFISSIIQKKLNQLFNCIPNTGYKMGDLKILKCKKWRSERNFRQYYAKSCKHRPAHGYIQFEVSPKQFSAAKIIGGLITCIEETLEENLFKVSILTSDKYYSKYNLEWKPGYLYKDHHFSTIEKVESAKLKALDAERYEAEYGKNYEIALNKFYGIHHSYEAGNCKVGTVNFINHAKINLKEIGGIRGDLLLELGKKFKVESFIERILRKGVEEIFQNSKVKKLTPELNLKLTA